MTAELSMGEFLQFSIAERGYPVNSAKQPVVRVSWNEAMAFCKWLSDKTGMKFTLPTEQQWRRAFSAGTDTAIWYGDVNDDFSQFANLADASFRRVDSFSPWSLPAGALDEVRPAIITVNDGNKVSANVGSYKPNTWGLYDMAGNVAEWTLDSAKNNNTRKIAVGGSWYDRPKNAGKNSKLYYHKWAGVFDVGFRVAMIEPSQIAKQ